LLSLWHWYISIFALTSEVEILLFVLVVLFKILLCYAWASVLYFAPFSLYWSNFMFYSVLINKSINKINLFDGICMQTLLFMCELNWMHIALLNLMRLRVVGSSELEGPYHGITGMLVKPALIRNSYAQHCNTIGSISTLKSQYWMIILLSSAVNCATVPLLPEDLTFIINLPCGFLAECLIKV